MQFKVIHRIITCNYWLYKLKITDTPECSFCEREDTIIHHLVACESVSYFWNSFLRWWNSIGYPQIQELTFADVIFGFPLCREEGKILNVCILLCKKIIIPNKRNRKKPFFCDFLVELNNYIQIEKGIHVNNFSLFMYLARLLSLGLLESNGVCVCVSV
mgnify:CR=1 FL=1